MISTLSAGTQPTLPSSRTTSYQPRIVLSLISTFVPSCIRKRSVLLSLGELFAVTLWAITTAELHSSIDFWLQEKFPEEAGKGLDNCSVSVVEISETGKMKLVEYNNTEYLNQ